MSHMSRLATSLRIFQEFGTPLTDEEEDNINKLLTLAHYGKTIQVQPVTTGSDQRTIEPQSSGFRQGLRDLGLQFNHKLRHKQT